MEVETSRKTRKSLCSRRDARRGFDPCCERPARPPIGTGHKEYACNRISESDPDEIMQHADQAYLGRVIAKKRQRKDGHIRHAVFEAAGNEREQTPEDQDAFGRVAGG